MIYSTSTLSGESRTPVSRDDVRNVVAIQIAQCYIVGLVYHCEAKLLLEGAITVTQEHRDIIGACVCRNEVKCPILVKISYRY